jgi:outer membrane protein TolC
MFQFARRRLSPLILALGSALLLLAAGCGTSYYRKSADKEAYQTITSRAPRVPNMQTNFTIEQTNQLDLTRLPVAEQAQAFLGPAGTNEVGATRLSLEEALDLAVKQSRNYQSAKEQLFLSALSLTLARYQFTPMFSGGGNANISGQQYYAPGTTFQVDPNNPTNLVPVVSDNLVEQNQLNANGTVNASWLIRDVGRLTAAFTADFSRFISGGPSTFVASQLGGTFTRPLLRDSGFKQEQESLTQSERNLFYALRNFTLFRKNFSVQIATAYYGVLGARDAVRNSYLNVQSSKIMGDRTRALSQEGRNTQADLGRIEQQELSAESAWINAIRNYKQSLDNFKIQLGLSTDARIVLDDRDLAQLSIRHPAIAPDDAIRVALAARLDYQNSKDQAEDSKRQIKLAADSLKTQLDLVASANITSQPNQSSGFPVPKPELYNWNAGFNLDLPLNRKSQRNSYRAALISAGQAARAVIQLEDDIKNQVRDNLRALEQAKRNYEIGVIGVKLAERRVEEQNLLAELGRARAQDQVDAQNALVDSKNQLTQALVNHTITRLQFWNSMGILYIKDNGQWQEVSDGKRD